MKKTIYYRGYKLIQTGDRGLIEVWFKLKYMNRWIFSDLYDNIQEAKNNIDIHLGRQEE